MSLKQYVGKIAKCAATGALILCSAAAANVAHAEEAKPAVTPKPTLCTKFTEVSTGKEPINRVEVIAGNLPGNSDIFFTYEQQGRNSMHKIRAQEFPISYGHLSLGVAAQYVGSNGSSHGEVGCALMLKEKTKNSSAKTTFRYFPAINTVDNYTTWDQKEVFFDVLSAYNMQSKTWYVRPGIDYKLNQNLSVGIEAKITGTSKGSAVDYTGIRCSVKF